MTPTQVFFTLISLLMAIFWLRTLITCILVLIKFLIKGEFVATFMGFFIYSAWIAFLTRLLSLALHAAGIVL